VAKTYFSNRLDEIIAHREIGGYLKDLHFRKRGHTFNRQTEPGIIQVINFQAGQNFSNEYGQFTVNLGIFVEEIFKTIFEIPVPDFPKEYHCEIRTRLGTLTPYERDHWWDLRENQLQASLEIGHLLQRYAIPFLDSFASREAIIEQWYAGRLARWLPARRGVSVAIVAAHLGRLEEAQQLLQEHYEKCIRENCAHQNFISRIATKLNVSLISTDG
jgi:hypothetical protein